MTAATCPALALTALASGQGKTTLTAALARRAVRAGRSVQVFKVGPDFLDPLILERASGRPVQVLDLWMVGAQGCRTLLHRAAQSTDLLLVEGVMGLYDGTPSTADLARTFGLPTAVVIDGAAMAQTFGALVRGLQETPGAPRMVGAFANRVDGDGHARLLADSLPAGVRLLGRLPSSAHASLPERHLGLHLAAEIDDLDARLDALAQALVVDDPAALAPPVTFVAPAPVEPIEPHLRGVRIGVARDEAFTFAYPANLELLEALGTRLAFFSPLHDGALPEVDALYLPGGYPELHAARYAANAPMHAALRAHHAAGRPLVAECGGLMALLDGLVDASGHRHRMAGLLRGESRMQDRVQAIGPQALDLPQGELRGHTFHHSRLVSDETPSARARHPLGGPGEVVFQRGRLTASYVHAYFPSNPAATAALFQP